MASPHTRRFKACRLLLAVTLAAAFTAASVSAALAQANTVRADVMVMPPASTPNAFAAFPKSQREGMRPQPLVITLSAPPEQKVALIRAAVPRPGVPYKTGFSRAIPELASAENTASRLNWRATPSGGFIAALSIHSPAATGLRIGLLVVRLPAAATLRFYSQAGSDMFEVPAQHVLDTLKRNRNAGDLSDEGRTYWSPRIDGAEMTLEVELPPGLEPAQLEFAVPRLLHIVLTPDALPQAAASALSASCEIDATCSPAWIKESNATVRIYFVAPGGPAICTGTLLNTTPTSGIPYLLTANHCISDQTAASSVETDWFYRASECNSGVINPGTVHLTGGATLLYDAARTDTSFLQLAAAPPAGAAFAGWTPSAPALGVQVTDLHNPMADLQKITMGTTSYFEHCQTPPGIDTDECVSVDAGLSADHIRVIFSEGIIESGSSGSGLFITDSGTGNHYLIGQAHSSDAVCGDPNAGADYGRFDFAYYGGLAQWLAPASLDAVSISISGNGTGTVQAAANNISCTASCNAYFAPATPVILVATPDAGSVFSGWTGACSGNAAQCTLNLAGAATAVSATFQSQAFAPQSGYWWNPAEPGRGFVVEVQESAMFMAGFLYGADGSPTWVASNGAMTSPVEYSGPLVTYGGGQTLTGAYKAATQNAAPIGTLSIVFSTASTGTLSWPGGSIPIQRFDFGPGGSAAAQPATTPQPGWWWNPAEGGRGFAVEIQGGTLYLAGYMYDPAGNPLWYLASGAMTNPQLFQGNWQQFGGGQTLTGAFHAASVVNANVGSVSLQFSGPAAATMTLPDGRQIPFDRFIFDSAPYANLAGSWSGTWQWSGTTSNGCAVSDGGTLSMSIGQSGASLFISDVAASGVNLLDSECNVASSAAASNGAGNGIVSGNNVNLAFVLPISNGALSFTGAAGLAGNTLTGNIVRSTGGSGSISLSRL